MLMAELLARLEPRESRRSIKAVEVASAGHVATLHVHGRHVHAAGTAGSVHAIGDGGGVHDRAADAIGAAALLQLPTPGACWDNARFPRGGRRWLLASPIVQSVTVFAAILATFFLQYSST